MQIVRSPPAHRKTARVEQRYTNASDAFKSRVEKSFNVKAKSGLLSQTNGLTRLQKYGRGQGE